MQPIFEIVPCKFIGTTVSAQLLSKLHEQHLNIQFTANIRVIYATKTLVNNVHAIMEKIIYFWIC